MFENKFEKVFKKEKRSKKLMPEKKEDKWTNLRSIPVELFLSILYAPNITKLGFWNF